MIPWNLFNLTPRDQASPLIRIVHNTQSGNYGGAVPSGDLDFTVPQEHVLLVTWVSATIAGIANPTRIELNAFDTRSPTYLHINYSSYRSALAAGGLWDNAWTGSPLFVLSEYETLRIRGHINVGNPWTMDATVCGILMPRGTMATA